MARGGEIPALLRLQDFAGTNGVRRQRDRAANFGGRKIRSQLQGLREQAVAKEHGDFIAPFRRDCRTAAPDQRLIHHVIVNQRGEVHHFDDDRRRDMRFPGLAETARRQRDEGGPQVLAAVVQRMLGVGNDLRVKIAGLPDELPGHRLKKRLHRFHDYFPGTGRVVIGSVSSIGTHHFRFSSQHRDEFTFVTQASQTCYILPPTRQTHATTPANSLA